jgi:hypothetical protein
MAAFSNSAWIGSRTVRPTEAQLTTIAQRDTGLFGVNMDFFWRHAGYFTLQFFCFTQPNDNAKRSIEFTAPIPFKVVKIDVGVESAAGTACVADIEKNPTGSPDTYATMSTGAVDVKTIVNNFVDLPVLNGAEDVAAGDQLQLVVTGTGAGAVVGGQAILHCFRL